MKKFFKRLDIILGILLIVCVIAGGIYIGFVDKDALKPTVTITLNCGGATIETDVVSGKKGKSIELPEPTLEGYVFDGWYHNGEKWTSDSKLSEDMELVAKWIPTQHAITFIVDGVEYTKLCDYGTFPEYDGTPAKSPTPQKQYTFSGWEPALAEVKGSATYTAKFTEETRKFVVTTSSTHASAGTITGGGEYECGATVNVSIDVNSGYVFLGWYKNGSLYSSDTSITLTDLSEDVSLEAQFQVITRTITYNNIHGVAVNPTTYNISLGNIILLSQPWDGYEFLGWYTEANGAGTKMEQIDCSTLVDYTLYAHYSIKTYTITYDLKGGTLSVENPTTYQITSSTFTLNNPIMDDYEFIGWTGTGLTSVTKTVIIQNGSYGNREYVAVWQPIYVTVSFSVEGMNLSSDAVTEQRGGTISSPSIDFSKYGMSGFRVEDWYTDSGCTTLFDFSTQINSSITLYGKWTYLIDDGFYPYLDRFNSARTSGTLTLTDADTEDTVVKWIEYIDFNNITEQINIVFSGAFSISDSSENGIKNKMANLIAKNSFPAGNTLSYSYSTFGTYKLKYVCCLADDGITNASLVADESKTGVRTQIDYALKKSTTPRGEDFSDYNINKINKTLTVSTTNQLVYALEKGLKPVCVAGSPAESAFNKAKEVLNGIIGESMTDLEKVRAIYDWLIENVNYDNVAVSSSAIINNWTNYDSWYLEGVFNNGVAVCDGYAKAFVVLARIENIPAIRVTGNNHAWNKVYVNNAWYGIDPTHGDIAIGGNEVFTYTSFLFTDAQKTALGFSSSAYPEIVADTNFNYYDYETYTTTSGEFDLLIDSYNEFNLLMASIEGYSYSGTYFSIEIAIEGEFYASISSFSGKVSGLFYNSGKTHSFTLVSYSERGADEFGNYVYILFIE